MRSESDRLGNGDEIDIFELIGYIWQKKLVVAVTTAIVTSIFASYAWLTTPVYEAKVFVGTPSQNDIAGLNYGRGSDTGLSAFKVKDVYQIFVRNLQSESLRREFFQKIYLPSLHENHRNGSQDELYDRFREVLSISLAAKDSPTRFVIKTSLSDPQQAAEWAQQYAEMAGQRGKMEVIKDAKADATVKASNLEQQIAAARESTRKQREDEVARLNEALKVAKSVGLEKPPIISNTLSSEVTAGMSGSLSYMRGSRALEAEIDNLSKRASDDPFVNNLRQREEALAFYRGLNIDPRQIEIYRQDGAIDSPDKPIKPRRMLIIILGFGMGVVLGVALALVLTVRARIHGKKFD